MYKTCTVDEYELDSKLNELNSSSNPTIDVVSVTSTYRLGLFNSLLLSFVIVYKTGKSL